MQSYATFEDAEVEGPEELDPMEIRFDPAGQVRLDPMEIFNAGPSADTDPSRSSQSSDESDSSQESGSRDSTGAMWKVASPPPPFIKKNSARD